MPAHKAQLVLLVVAQGPQVQLESQVPLERPVLRELLEQMALPGLLV
jgi:hypothetical protein